MASKSKKWKEVIQKKTDRSDPEGLLWLHGPSAVPDRFTGAVVYCCTFEVFVSGSRNPVTFLELGAPGH